ncbi:MAG TPA: site-specific integrase [Trebonia sp.]|nr:site-specific integrase [Trebonia sp.]
MASARKRGDRWTGLYRDADGKQKSAGSFNTEDEALARARVAELDARPPDPVEIHPSQVRGKVTVAAYAPGWLEGQALLEANSVEIARSALKRIMPHLGGKAREEVTPDDVRRMLAALKKSGLSDGTVARTLDAARQLLPKAATEGVRYRIKERRRMKVATTQQAAAIEAAMLPRYKLLVHTAFATGMRWGELIAIRGTDIEKRGNSYVLKVQRTIEEVGTRFTERGYGKSAKATREISILRPLAQELMAFGTDLCFTGPRGGYLARCTFRRVFWLPAIERAGMPGMRVHDMRHSAISWWVAACIPLADVRDRAGHSSIAVTNTYCHSIPTDEDPFLAVFGKAA